MPRIIIQTETFGELEQKLRERLKEVEEINQMIAAGEIDEEALNAPENCLSLEEQAKHMAAAYKMNVSDAKEALKKAYRPSSVCESHL